MRIQIAIFSLKKKYIFFACCCFGKQDVSGPNDFTFKDKKQLMSLQRPAAE